MAIDVGNTHTVVGVHDGADWIAMWRRSTDADDTEDQIGVWLRGLFDLSGLPWKVDSAICASVVPALDPALDKMCERWLNVRLRFLRRGDQVGLKVSYEPPTAVGADRLANALGALVKYRPPIIVVDFGTATTFDAIDSEGTYAGGAILPGVHVSSQALFGRAAKLPAVEFKAPEKAIGKTTVQSLQSGIMLGYAGAIDALAARIGAELGEARVIATGGLGSLFLGLCESLEEYEPTLTLDGLLVAHERLSGN
ncbi:type III pantothenate kinase [Fimbriimonas ginsengisoli]|uniref:type III pantothenate kinase n=1 Tax=Fimbriimonas ginsengisoli TaxID=1005039 RepID=UPI0022352FE7|nr:type III pantothenate kinase [Fimbriimonas ginsengisoli]